MCYIYRAGRVCSACVCVRMGCVSNVGLAHVGDSPAGKATPLLLRASCARSKYGRYPNTAIRRRFLSALFRSRPRYRRNKTCVHGRSIAPSVSTSCLVRKARRETGRSSIASYGHFSAHARATNAIKLAFMAGLAPSGRALLGKRLEWHQFSSKLVYIAINQKGAERPCLLAVKHLQCVSGHTANA